MIDAAQVGIEHVFPLLGRKLVQRGAKVAHAGVVDQDVCALEGLLHTGGQGLDCGQIGDITGHGLALATRCGDGLSGLLQGRQRASANDGVGSQGSQFLCYSSAYTTASAGDDGNLPIECSLHN